MRRLLKCSTLEALYCFQFDCVFSTFSIIIIGPKRVWCKLGLFCLERWKQKRVESTLYPRIGRKNRTGVNNVHKVGKSLKDLEPFSVLFMPVIARGVIIDFCTLWKKRENFMRWNGVMVCNSTLQSLHTQSTTIGLEAMNYSTSRRPNNSSWKTWIKVGGLNESKWVGPEGKTINK